MDSHPPIDQKHAELVCRLRVNCAQGKFEYKVYNLSMAASASVLTTKFFIPPPPPRLVARTRLIDRLNEGLSLGRKLTLISAPAGFGKTTLVSEWIVALPPSPLEKGVGVRAAWLSLDENDNDPGRFLGYLVAALQKLVPNLGEGVLEALHASPTPPLEALITTLVNEIAGIPDGFVLVLDDYHTVDSEPVDRALTFLAEHMPAHMHLLIATREDPQLPLARLRARGQLTELRTPDLRFTPAEAADFLTRVMGLDLSAEEIAALESRTEGWIAGLQLAALSMQGNRDMAGFIQSFSGSHRFVLDYLLEEVLQRQPEEVLAFLLRTSLLERLCGPLCEALLPDAGRPAQETLESLERANLFVIPLDDERRWYRYHHLFRELLRQRAGQTLAPADMARLHIRASEWFEQNGEPAAAFQHAIAARDFDRGARLAEITWQKMDETFQTPAWLGWVKQLPESVILARPVLCTQIGWAFMDAGEVQASESRLRDAQRRLEGPAEGMVIVEQEQFQTLPARIAIAHAYNAVVQGNSSDALRYAEQALDLIPDPDHFLRAQARSILVGVHWPGGELEVAYRDMTDWVESSRKVGNFIFAIASASAQADILIALGRLRQAVSLYRESLEFAATQGREAERIIAHHHLGLAMLYHEMGDDEPALQHFEKSMELGRQSTQVDWPYRRCIAQARWKESQGDLNAAREFLEEAGRLYIRTPMPDLRPVSALKARLDLRQGRLSEAREWGRSHAPSIGDDLSFLREFEHITLARLLIAEYQNRREERSLLDAVDLLERLLGAAEAGKRNGSVLEIRLVQALAHRAHANTAAALSALQHALTLAEPEGYIRSFVDEGEPLRELLVQLKAQRTGTNAYIEKLLAAFPQPATTPPSEIKDPDSQILDPLSPRELEVLGLIARGLSNVEISRRLFVTISTVKGHNLRIFAKLQAKSRTEAVARARALGLL